MQSVLSLSLAATCLRTWCKHGCQCECHTARRVSCGTMADHLLAYSLASFSLKSNSRGTLLFLVSSMLFTQCYASRYRVFKGNVTTACINFSMSRRRLFQSSVAHHLTPLFALSDVRVDDSLLVPERPAPRE